jgi:hypothetical protein
MIRTRSVLLVGLLTSMIVCQCNGNATRVTEPESIVFETDESSSSTSAGGTPFWAKYSCIKGSDGSNVCTQRYLKIGDDRGTLFEIDLGSSASANGTLELSLYNGMYNLSVSIQPRPAEGSDGSHASELRTLRITVVQKSIPQTELPPCQATSSMLQELSTNPYTLESVSVSGDELFAWITYLGGSEPPQFSLVTRRKSLAPLNDTTEVFLRYTSGSAGNIKVKARIGFNLVPLADLIASQAPCLCTSALRVYRPQNNWHNGFQLVNYLRSSTVSSAGSLVCDIPLTNGNYWVYRYSDTRSSAVSIESITVALLPTETCKRVYLISRAGLAQSPSFRVEDCAGNAFVAGVPWLPSDHTTYFTRTVPAGTFDKCYTAQKPIGFFTGQDYMIYAEGVGVIERSKAEVSVHPGGSYSWSSELLRYHVASE